MKRITGFLLGATLLLGQGVVAAQETSPPPKVLTIIREFVKPGRGGAAHEKSESAFVQAFARAKWPTHYLAVDSLSGKSRTLFLTGYDSFEAWEKDAGAVQKDSALSSALDRASAADGDLLSEIDASTLMYNEEYSLRAPVDIAHMRYFEISVFHIRPGHRKEWDEGVKMVKAAYEKAVPDAHWATYEAIYGLPQGTYVFFTPMKSAAEIDHAFAKDKDFVSAMGEGGMKKLEELSAASIESSESQLFAFNPRMSYVSEDWTKADPDFWKPKAAKAPSAMGKKAEEKPAAKQ
jgi:hypothetical protein